MPPLDETIRSYPTFHDAEAYVAKRSRRRLRDVIRFGLERWVLDRVLRGVPVDVKVLDVPCGPGRLAPYWKGRGWKVLGVDYSDPMIASARLHHEEKGRPCEFRQGDAFRLDLPDDAVDLIASIRFIYYFDEKARAALLREFARVTRDRLLLQFKEGHTLSDKVRTRRRRLRSIARDTKKKFSVPRRRIVRELEANGFRVERIVRAHPLTDRTFVLARLTA